MSEIELVSVDDVVGRGRGKGRTKGQKYGKYIKAIAPQLDWIEQEIEHSKDGTIRMKVADIAKEMGKDFTTKHETSIYWGLKYSLFQDGIVVDMSSHKDGGKILVMRQATEEDRLPLSLSKYLENADVGEAVGEADIREDED